MNSKFMRRDDRAQDSLRDVVITPDFITSADGSCIIACGQTRVICTATVEDRVPKFLENAGLGWVTAEYNMLPASTSSRISREKVANAGRTYEIQRLIGRSLRACIDRKKLGQRTITIDCDVIQADGGTRTAAITGGYIALKLAIKKLIKAGLLTETPIVQEIAAISLGRIGGHNLLDLDFIEDSSADIDANLVATAKGEIVEWQATAERALLPNTEMQAFLELGLSGIQKLIDIQRDVFDKK